MAQLSILTLNIQGSQNSLKRFQIINFVKMTGKQINCLQDTHTLEKDESNWRLLWRGPIFFSHLSTRQGGVMIAFSQDLDFVLLCLIEIIKGRLLYVKFKSNEKIYHVINIYATPEIGEKIYMYNKLSTFLDDLQTSSIF